MEPNRNSHPLAAEYESDDLLSGFAVDLGPPPAHADEKKSPVVEELRWLAFKGVPDELQQPSQNKQRERPPPKAVTDKSSCKHGQREQDGRDPVGMTNTVDRVLVASLVLCDPLLAALSAEHAADDDSRRRKRLGRQTGMRKQWFRQGGLLQRLLTELSTAQLSVLIPVLLVMFLPQEKWKKTPQLVAFAGLKVVPGRVLPRRGGGLLHPAAVEAVACRVVAS